MRSIDLSAWPHALERQLAAIPVAIEAAATAGGETAKLIARGKIAHYQPAIDEFPGWAPLAESTVQEKTRLGYAPPDNPLLRTGEMRDSIDSHILVTPREVISVLSSDDPIMYWQENGTDKIPPRPVIGPSMLQAAPIFERELSRALVMTLSGDRYAASNIGFVAFQGDVE